MDGSGCLPLGEFPVQYNVARGKTVGETGHEIRKWPLLPKDILGKVSLANNRKQGHLALKDTENKAGLWKVDLSRMSGTAFQG